MIDSKMTETIFIDWDGTLSKSRFWEQWRDDTNCSRYYQTISDKLFSDDKPTIDAWMRGELSAEDVCEKLTKVIDLSKDEILEALRVSCESMVVVDSALDKVQHLRQLGKKVIIATDNMDTFSRWTVPALRLDRQFDDIINSASIGSFKKDKTDDGSSLFFRGYLNDGKYTLIDDSPNADVVEDFGITWLPVDEKTAVDWLDEIILRIIQTPPPAVAPLKTSNTL